MSWAIWITGLPGSGKSVVTQAVARRLVGLGEPVTVLELDVLRRTLTPSPTYGEGERELVYRGLVWLARTLTESRVPVLIDATGHRRAWRDLARAVIPEFAEVQLLCPLGLCRERERGRTGSHAPPGVYDAAGRPGSTVPGVDVPYEPALAPELVVDTAREDVEAAAARVLSLALTLAAAAPPRLRSPRPGWAIWITGLPGSGKSTLASRVAGSGSGTGRPLRILDAGEVSAFLLPGGRPGPTEEELIHRTLVCGARLLVEAGLAVIVDATARHRRWRQLARQLIRHFAEVQLLCPPATCAERERAVRWRLGPCPWGARTEGPTSAEPEVAVGYEPSLDAELIIHTDRCDPDHAAAQVLRLAARLERAAAATAEVAQGGLHARP